LIMVRNENQALLSQRVRRHSGVRQGRFPIIRYDRPEAVMKKTGDASRGVLARSHRNSCDSTPVPRASLPPAFPVYPKETPHPC
jgi:hypothetical protein